MVYGQKTAYYEEGHGKQLILLANIGWDANFWFRNMPELAKHFHVIAIDLIGQGASSKPNVDYKMDTWTEWISEFMRLKGIEKATVGGAVMGGALSVQFALDFPEKSEGVIVAASNSGPGHAPGNAVPKISSSIRAVRQDLMTNFFDKRLVTEDFVRSRYEYRLRANDGYVILRHLGDHRPPFSKEELARIQVPALFVWCAEDEVTPLEWGKAFAAPLPNATFVTLSNCGHYPNLEKPAEFNKAVESFVEHGK